MFYKFIIYFCYTHSVSQQECAFGIVENPVEVRSECSKFNMSSFKKLKYSKVLLALDKMMPGIC